IYDVEYDYWQNAKDPLQYEAVGRDYSHLPMRSNGLPPPVERMEIDTSENPGRWIFREGYIEAVGSVMWLVEPFWDYVGMIHKKRFDALDWISVQWLECGVVNLIAATDVLRGVSTAKQQICLRELLYGPVSEGL